jgi:hypothetical protein
MELAEFHMVDLDQDQQSPVGGTEISYYPGECVKCAIHGKNKKQPLFFLAIVVETVDNEVHLNVMHRAAQGVYTFPIVKDSSWEPLTSISRIPVQPIEKKRKRYCLLNGTDPLS